MPQTEVIMPSIEQSRVPSARRRHILDYLSTHGSASVGQLATALGVSTATVHRDLRTLEEESALFRVQGGATAVDPPSAGASVLDSSWPRRVRKDAAPKLAVGLAATTLVSPGDTIFIDASTTALAFAGALEASGIAATIVTTSPAIAQTLTSPSLRIVVVPGQVDQELRIITGSWANEFMEGLNFTSAFVSCAGINDQVLFTEVKEIQVTLQTALSRAKRKVCIVDSSKLGRTASLALCPISSIDTIVVDDLVSSTPWLPSDRVIVAPPAKTEDYRGSAIFSSYFS